MSFKEIIKITEDKREMIMLAKQIIEENPQKYTKRVIGNIKEVIETNAPELSAEEKKNLFYVSVYDYWAYGIKTEEEFYYGLRNKGPKEKKEYITYMEHIIYAYHLNKKENRYLLYNKYETYKFFKEYYKRDVIFINGEEDYEIFREFVLKHQEFIVKPVDSHMAIGVYKEALIEKTEESISKLYIKICSVGNLNVHQHKAKIGGSVLEEILVQDERMDILQPQGVSDVRCTTIRKGNVIIYYPWLSTGRSGKFITPYGEGRIVWGVNAQTGIVETAGYTERGEIFQEHPDTKMNLVGFQIPEWKALVELVTELAQKLPDINYVGWDMVLTRNGWAIQEANFAGEPIWQMLYGKGNKMEFERLIDWKITKDFWWQEEVER